MNQQFLPPAPGCLYRNTQVVGNRVMKSRHQGQAHFLDLQHAITEALVIVYQVVVVSVLLQILDRPTTKGIGLGKSHRQLSEPLDEIAQGLEVPWPQGAEAVHKKIQAGQLDQFDPRVQVGVVRA